MKRHCLSYADWSWREFAVIAKCLLTGQVHRGQNIARLTAALGQFYTPSEVYLFNYAHHAIEVALGVFKQLQPDRTEVIVPAYICPSVIQAVTACGLTVRSVDVAADLNICPVKMQAAMHCGTLAVIAPHMYGCPADIHTIEDICRSSGVFLIDDAAQVIGVRQDERLLGTFGDFGVVSFAQSKTIVTGIHGSGGVLIVNKPAYSAAIRSVWQGLPAAKHRLSAMADFLWNYVLHGTTGNSGYYLKRMYEKFNSPSLEFPVISNISNVEAGIALEQLIRLPEILRNKLRIVNEYDAKLAESGQIEFPQYANDRFLARVMLSLPRGVDIAAFRLLLERQGVESRTGYPSADKVAGRLFGVPCNASMTNQDIADICGTVISVLKQLHASKSTDHTMIH